MNWTIGADVEVMLEKNGKLVSAVPVFPPDTNGDELPKGVIFHDNVLAEFTVSPAESADEFAGNILDNLASAREMLQKHQMNFRMEASARYPAEELQSNAAKRFGCSPDYDAYEMKVNDVAFDAHETDLRSAGGHIHFAHPVFEDPYKVVDMVKLMDLFIGVPSILKDNSPEARERRTLYGKAGAHRPKDYPGGEYRALSNFWIRDEETIRWVYAQTQRCLELVVAGETIETLGYDPNEIRRIINEADESAAKELVEAIG